jgi:HAD superfamily hydrolase (TIGR01509 family)
VITTVVFDVDETIVDTRAAVDAALAAVLTEFGPVPLTLDEMRADWAAALVALAPEPTTTIRRAAMRASLARVGLVDRLDEVLAFYFAERFARTRPFADTLPTIAALRGDFRVGLATNGNSRADRCGLAGQFDFEVYAHEGGVPKKPDPGFYAAVAAAADVPAVEIVHVGDNLHHDVVAAEAAGMRTVWLNRTGRPGAAESELRTLPELPALLGRLKQRCRSIP